MNLKPLKFIGYKIGPFFEHIELTWDQDSRYTLIVGENGMGKTTLVAAMAACLSFGDDTLFPAEYFQRFAHDEESFAYFEIKIKNETGWLQRWGSEILSGTELEAYHSTSKDAYPIFSLDPRNRGITNTTLRLKAHYLPEYLWNTDPEDTVLIESAPYEGEFSIQMACSRNLLPVISAWHKTQEIKLLTAAYGVNRDIQHVNIREYQDLDDNPLHNILNSFVPPSTNIFQWIANQFVNNALALSEGKPAEAEAYLAAVHRVEQLLSEDLEAPISFHLKRNPFRLEIHQNGAPLPFDQLSDGTRSLLSWPLDYLMRASRVNWADPADSAVAPGLILVDEIDMHLHPEWQRRIIPAVSRLLPETYLIATTHSPFVLGAADDAQVFQIYEYDETGYLSVRSSFDELYGYPADLILKETFTPSLYAPEVAQKLERLSNLAAKVVAGDVTAPEKAEHDQLLRELAEKNPWLNSLLALSQTNETST